MSDNKTYYYIKLKDNHFDQQEIKILESLPNGYEYSSFFLKLILLSLRDNGRLMVKDSFPYTPELLSAITGHNIDSVNGALKALHKLQLIELLDSKVIFISNIEALVGQSSTEAERKKLYRNRIKSEQVGHLSDICPPENRDKRIELKEKKKEKASTTRKGTMDGNYTEDFDRIWNLYPRKIGKAKAFDKWKTLTKEEQVEAEKKIPQYAKSVEGGEPKFIKHLSTWLNQRVWEDEFSEPEVAYVPPVGASNMESWSE